MRPSTAGSDILDTFSLSILTSKKLIIERRNSAPWAVTLSASHLSRFKYSRREASAATSRAKVKGRESKRFSRIYSKLDGNLDMKRLWSHLEVLRNIQNPSNVEGALVIEVTKGAEKIRRIDLPQPHEDKLMVRMTCQKHSQQLARILETNITPILIL